jgi:hypothetical protein
MTNQVISPKKTLVLIQNYSDAAKVSSQILQRNRSKQRSSNITVSRTKSRNQIRKIVDTPYFCQPPGTQKDRINLDINKPFDHFLSCDGKVLFQLMSNDNPNLVIEYPSKDVSKFNFDYDFVSLNFVIPTRICRSILLTDLNDPSSVAEYGSTFEHFVTVCIVNFKVNITSSIYALLKEILNQSRIYFSDLNNRNNAKVSGKKLAMRLDQLNNICKSISELNEEDANYQDDLDELIEDHVAEYSSTDDDNGEIMWA